MKKKLIATVIALTAFVNVYAGGLLTNTNQNIAFLRNPARGASIEIDAAFSNPAGLAFLKNDGFFISLNNASAFQTRTIKADFAPFAGYGGQANKTFEGETKALVIPNLQAAYKTGNLVISANIGIFGGGGTADFTKGLPSFESTVAIVPALLKGMAPNLGFGEYALDSRLKGSSLTFGAQLGVTYKIIEHLSAHVGLRYNIVDNGYDGYLKKIQLSMGGNMVPASTVLAANPAFGAFAQLLAEKELDCKQTGSGLAPIIGVDYHLEKLNIGVKYEFKTGIKLKNKTKVNSTGVADYNDGVKTPYDLPALLTVGAQYDIICPLTISAGYHHFFDSDAKMANDKQKFIDGGINEYLAGLEYRINDMFLISCGGQLTKSGVSDNYQSDMSYSLNSYSVGFGGAVNITKNLRVNVAYFFTTYEDWTKKSTDYGNINKLSQGAIPATPGSDTYGRTNKSFGIGLDFRF
jgi:long-chain fatty acid transport protein